MYDKNKLSYLMKEAIKYDTITKFSNKTGVNRTYISQMVNMTMENRPLPDTLKSIANNSDVEYKDLMDACGYLEGIYYSEESKNEIESVVKENKELYDFWNTIKKRDDLQLMFKQSKKLSPKAINNIIEIMMMIEQEEGTY